MRHAILAITAVLWLGAPLCAAERSVQRIVSMEYPDLAVAARMGGEVLVESTLDYAGNVVSARVLPGSGTGLDQVRAVLGKAAVENVKQWRFEKGTEATASSTVHVVYRFKLENVEARKRTTHFVFEFPNVVYVTSSYIPLTP